MIGNTKIIFFSTSQKSIFIAYEVISYFLGIIETDKKYYIVNAFSSEKLPALEIMRTKFLEDLEKVEKYKDSRLKKFDFSTLPLVNFPKISAKIKIISKQDFDIIKDFEKTILI